MTRFQRLQALLGENFCHRDVVAAWEERPDELRAAGGTSWTLTGLARFEFPSKGLAESFRSGMNLRRHDKHQAVEGPASSEYVLGLHGMGE